VPKKGKANFFLLDAIPSIEVKTVPYERAVPAVDVIRVDLPYQGLLNYLMANTYIFDGEIEDFIIDEKYKDSIFLSGSGTFIKTATSLSGGSVGLFEGKKIGRKKNLEKLNKLLAKEQEKKTIALQRLEAVKEELVKIKSEHSEDKFDALNQTLNGLRQQHTKLESEAGHLQRRLDDFVQKLQENTGQIEDRSGIIQNKEAEQLQLRNQMAAIETSFAGEKGSLDELSQHVNSLTESYNSANIALIKHQNFVQNFTKEYDFKKTRLNEIEQRVRDDKKKLETAKKELIEGRSLLTVLDKKLQALYTQKSGFQGTLSETEQAYYEARNTIAGMEEEVKNINRALNQKQVEINQLKEKFNDVRFSITAVGERLNIEFGIPIKEVLNQEIDETMPLEDLEHKVEKIKTRLANYGEINPMALEAYEEIKERYENIITQRKDILEAKESLLSTISEIEATATAQFMESFNAVRENFIMVFRSLFTEDDNCDLILLNPEDPLESNIEIVAKPKGKKPKSLSQLSGGEKTLTATALLFALYLLKPAPFCIFDEVDAPLDDANIQKFNKIIKKFSRESQFIIVTHNKATMAAVDVLYGVYMREMGVSGVAPVDFRSLKEQPIFETVAN
jgi:chromosome segregation protein